MVMLLAVGFHGVLAQEKTPSSDEKADRSLKGQVVDARTGDPLIGAFVRVEGDEWGSLSDKDGSFGLPDMEPGLTPIMVEQLGYVTLRQEVDVKENGEAVTLRVEPDPILKEGIEGLLDRLETRRKGAATSSWVLNRADLLSNPSIDALSLLRARTPVRLVPCGVGGECALVQGRVSPISVYVDEMPFLGGMDYLRSQQPYELQRIEVFAGGRHIRIYTEGYLKRAGIASAMLSAFIL